MKTTRHFGDRCRYLHGLLDHLATGPTFTKCKGCARLLPSRRQVIAVSDKTLWELCNLIERDRIQVPLGQYLRYVERHFIVLSINADIAERSVSFSKRFSKDPVDRLIAATALSHGAALVTGHRAIRKSKEVPCI